MFKKSEKKYDWIEEGNVNVGIEGRNGYHQAMFLASWVRARAKGLDFFGRLWEVDERLCEWDGGVGEVEREEPGGWGAEAPGGSDGDW